jgi:hypothetical protein
MVFYDAMRKRKISCNQRGTAAGQDFLGKICDELLKACGKHVAVPSYPHGPDNTKT